jgi:hypothetical protein
LSHGYLDRERGAERSRGGEPGGAPGGRGTAAPGNSCTACFTEVVSQGAIRQVDGTGEVAHSLAASGMNAEPTRQAQDNLVTGQLVALSNDELHGVAADLAGAAAHAQGGGWGRRTSLLVS